MGEDLTRAALTDELTGLYNRRYLNRRLPGELKKAKSSSTPLSLMILDIDYFKDINDTYGHRAGDDALVKISNLLAYNVRDTDTVFRYAGDEFAIVLSNTDNDTAMEIAGNIAERVSCKALEILDKTVNVSISVGVATYPEDGDDLNTLFDFADQALYSRKRRGRDGACGRIEVNEDADFLRPTSCPELVGRKEELERLKKLLGGCFKGSGNLVLLSGQAGVGKTRLINEFVDVARRRDALILPGRCFGEPTSFPYQPFKDALSKYVDTGNGNKRAILQGLPEVYRNELLDLIPEFTELDVKKRARVELEPEQARFRIFDTVRQFLIRISKETPLILVLEDIHLADESSSQLIHYLALNLRESSVLICVSVRSEELELETNGKKPFAKVMLSMSRDNLFTHIKLKTLSLKETARMIGLTLNTDKVSELFSERVFRETEGNPFFVEEVVKSLIENGKISSRSELDNVNFESFEIPTAIRDVIQRRLDMLDPETNHVLIIASMIGKSFHFEVLQLASNLSESHLLEHLEQALRSKLVIEENEDEYRFSHSKITQTLYESLSGRRKRKLHQTVGTSIEKIYGDKIEDFVYELSHHFTKGKEWSKSFQYSYQAGNRAKKQYANNDAVFGYRRALEAFAWLSSDEQGERNDSATDIYRNMGDVLELLSKYEDALGSYEEMQKLAIKMKNRKMEGNARRNIGGVHYSKGSYDEAMRYYEEAIAIQREINNMRGIAHCLTSIGLVHQVKGSYDEAMRQYEEAMPILREIGDKRLIASCLIYIGLVHYNKSSNDEAMRYYEEALVIQKEIGNKLGIVNCLNYIGLVHYYKPSYDEAMQYYEESMVISREIGDKRGIASCLNYIGGIHYMKGSYDEAMRCNEDALVICREIGTKRGITYCLIDIGAVHYMKGFYDESMQYNEDARVIFREISDKRGIAYCLNDIGLVQYMKGSYDEAMRYYEEAIAIQREIGNKRGIAVSMRSKCNLMRQYGIFEEAMNGHEQVISMSKEFGDRNTEILAMTDLGLDHLDANNLDEAFSTLNKALELAMKIQSIESEVLALQGLGEISVRRGDSDKANEIVEKLLRIAERTQSRMYLVKANLLRARYLHLQVTQSSAEKTLKLAEEMGAPESVWRAHHIMYRILEEKEDTETAKIHFQEAKKIVESIATRISDPEMRKSYLAKPDHKELFDTTTRAV